MSYSTYMYDVKSITSNSGIRLIFNDCFLEGTKSAGIQWDTGVISYCAITSVAYGCAPVGIRKSTNL